jgi:hypothetical protein
MLLVINSKVVHMNYKKVLGSSLIFIPTFVLGNPSFPEQIYNTAGGYGCSACHGKYAHGGGFAGGNIRGATREQLDNALETESTMLLLAEVLDENKRNALVDYLATLSEMQLLEWRIGESATTVANVKAGQRIQLVLFNSTFETLSLDLSAINSLKNYQIEAYDTKAITWIPKVGRYSFSSENEHFIIDIN